MAAIDSTGQLNQVAAVIIMLKGLRMHLNLVHGWLYSRVLEQAVENFPIYVRDTFGGILKRSSEKTKLIPIAFISSGWVLYISSILFQVSSQSIDLLGPARSGHQILCSQLSVKTKPTMSWIHWRRLSYSQSLHRTPIAIINLPNASTLRQ